VTAKESFQMEEVKTLLIFKQKKMRQKLSVSPRTLCSVESAVNASIEEEKTERGRFRIDNLIFDFLIQAVIRVIVFHISIPKKESVDREKHSNLVQLFEYSR
jgi:hypothetical protein